MDSESKLSSPKVPKCYAGRTVFTSAWRFSCTDKVHAGRQELFDSGVLHAYMYSRLYNPHSQIIARTTVCILATFASEKATTHRLSLTRFIQTQDRMLKSAEYFMAGFFGLEWYEYFPSS